LAGDTVLTVENRAINQDNGFPGLALLKMVSFENLIERMRILERDRSIESSNAKRWLDGGRPPSPQNAWAIGEALGYADEHVTAMIPGASGLLALYWFRHLADFVGILSCLNPNELVPFEPRLMAMLRTLRTTAHVSPYDALPSDHEILTTHADDFALRHVADARVIRIPPTLSYRDEANAINERRVALEIWQMPAELRDAFRAAAKSWLGGDGPTFGPRDEERLGQASRPLRHAYAVAKSDIEDDVAVYLIVDNISQWFYSNAIPEPPAETLSDLAELASDPQSATARALLTGYRSYGLLREE
jgi:hypothetical protein